jgi:hypothetical protein
MKKILFSLIALVGTSAFFTSCSKEEDLTGTGSVFLHFDHKAGDQVLALGQNYVTANGDTVNFSTFQYFVSNFVLEKADGSTFVVPRDSCYFLVDHARPETQEIELRNVPAGDYTGVRFVIGVDSAKSASPLAERTGVLDPATGAQGMYWMWNSGYIFVKVEGTSPQAPVNGNGLRAFLYHIGGFGGYNAPTINNLKTAELHAHDGEVAEVRNNRSPELHTMVDILEVFKTPTAISVAANPVVMFNPFSTNVANNYADMFVLDHIHN